VTGRLERCRRLLDELGLDAVLVTDAADVRYLSGFRGEDAMLVIGRHVALICTDSRFWAQVREEVRDFELVKTERLLSDAVAAAADRLTPQAALGFQGGVLSYEEHRTLRRRHRGRLKDVRARVSHLRQVKDEAEVDAVRRACAAAD
jgi:Xaa-Pro aminopeptidase